LVGAPVVAGVRAVVADRDVVADVDDWRRRRRDAGSGAEN
jgi:hypothetical protein